MAKAKEPASYEREMVDFYAFKDNNKYKDDIVVGVNGRIFRIQRGKHVQIPRYLAMVLEQSMAQDAATADFIGAQSEAYNAISRIMG